MPSKYYCVGQDSECLFLNAKVDLLGETMPVPCTHCCLLQEKGEKVEYKVFLNYFYCGECCYQGLANYNAYKVEDFDCWFFLSLFLVFTNSSSPLIEKSSGQGLC